MMSQTARRIIRKQTTLLKTSRFGPLLALQFLAAFNLNLLIFGVLTRLHLMEELAFGGAQFAALCGFALILPWLLGSGLAGDFARKYPGRIGLLHLKTANIAVAALAALALVTALPALILLALFGLSLAVVVMYPLKYTLIADHLKRGRLIGAVGMMVAALVLGAMIGGIMGSAVTALPLLGPSLTGLLLFLAAILARQLAHYVYQGQERAESETAIRINPLPNLKTAFCRLRERKAVFLASLGVAWFAQSFTLGFGITLLQFRAEAGGHVLSFAVTAAVLCLGIAVGAMLNNRLLRSHVTAKYVPLACFGMGFFAFDLFFATPAAAMHLMQYQVLEFSALLHLAVIRMLLDLFALGVMSGLFVVPLLALLQSETDQAERPLILSASVLMNGSFILLAAFIFALLRGVGIGAAGLFMLMAGANLILAIYLTRILPDEMFKTFLRSVFTLLFRVEVKGLENYIETEGKGIIICNHVSFLDAPLLAAFLPGRPMFAVNSEIAQSWWVRPWLFLVEYFPLDATNPLAAKGLIEEVQKGKKCIIFPEGRLTTTGSLMKIYEGSGMIIDKADAPMIPTRIDGVQHSHFSRLKGKVTLKLFPKIIINIQKPVRFSFPDGVSSRVRRGLAGMQLYDIMSEMMFCTGHPNRTLYNAMLDARLSSGGGAEVAEDIESKLTFNRLRLGTVILGRKIAAMTQRGEHVGVLLPNMVGLMVTFFALGLYGRVPTMLNFSAGSRNVLSAVQTAQVKTVLTARRFIDKGRLEDLIAALEPHVKIVYLEDVREGIGPLTKIFGLLSAPFARLIHKRQNITPDETGVILFTSGSEGSPKGVVLSHRNIVSNALQIAARVDFNKEDKLFNALPMFHSFGLTGGMMMPLLFGVRSFQYPSPLHYRIVPELIYATNATIMFGTDTFLAGYAQVAHPYDFYRMRYVFAGAEKLKPETRRLWIDKFGIRILEGYGTTECAPAVSVNTVMHYKNGTVGRLLPGMEAKLHPVEGVDAGGSLVVRGPNIMRGYLLPDNPGVLVPPEEGWYDTGDIVDIDEDGFIKIVGRAKRFAKIAGEMISLAAVEAICASAYPDKRHAVVSLPDPKKGEKLVLVTDCREAKREDLTETAKRLGYAELTVPRKIIIVPEVPLLGSGKVDYTMAQRIAGGEDIEVHNRLPDPEAYEDPLERAETELPDMHEDTEQAS